MPGTATNYDITKTAKSRCQIWANLAIPSVGSSLTLHTDGTPESVANPSAKHLGMTREGATFTLRPSFENDFADDFKGPIRTTVGDIEAIIACEILQVEDTDFWELLTPGVGSKGTGVGFERVQFGSRAIVYTSVALIFPLETDPTKFGVFQLYKTHNQGGIEIAISRKKLSGIAVQFRGFEITSRSAVDTIGQAWKQVA